MAYVNTKIGNAPRPAKYQLLPFVMMVAWVLEKLELGRQYRRYSNMGICKVICHPTF